MARKRTYTIAEAADLTGLSRKAVARRIERGSLRSVVRNGRRLIPRSELVRTGLLADEPDGREAVSADLPLPAGSAEGDSAAALVGLVRDLMERVERQATEIAQFRALTVQAESLRADRELAELRARLAALESRPDGYRAVREPDALAHAPQAPRASHSPASAPIWLPPSAAAPRATSTPPARRPVAEPPAFDRGASPSSRWAMFGAEAAFIVLVAVLAALADLRPAALVGVIALAWALVAAVEVVAWRRRRP